MMRQYSYKNSETLFVALLLFCSQSYGDIDVNGGGTYCVHFNSIIKEGQHLEIRSHCKTFPTVLNKP